MNAKKPIAIVLGTRPEIIKLSTIIEECNRRELDYFIVHTGQHYTPSLDEVFFENLKLPQPQYNLGVGSREPAEMIGHMILGLLDVFRKKQPGVVLVQGDTNSVLAGALAAHKAGIPVGHVEAGLRSFDRSMPEEINRVITDLVSDLLFAPTEEARGNLLAERIAPEHIHVVGNTIVDAVLRNRELARERAHLFETFGIEKSHYALLTLHRPSNVDDAERLRTLLSSIAAIAHADIGKILFPVHPRTAGRLERFGIKLPKNVVALEPTGYLDFLFLLSNAALVLTDSGGIQEEACVLHIPCVTLRENTERPETIVAGANVLAQKPEDIAPAVHKMLSRERAWKNPFGDGRSAARILDLVAGLI